jgi:hypothetical protein
MATDDREADARNAGGFERARLSRPKAAFRVAADLTAGTFLRHHGFTQPAAGVVRKRLRESVTSYRALVNALLEEREGSSGGSS